jgi:hypothetical protein
MGKSFIDFLHPSEAQKFHSRENLFLCSPGTISHNFVSRFRAKDGSYRHLEWRYKSQNNLIYAAARDVTASVEEKKALELLVKSSEEFLLLSHEYLDYQKISDTMLSLSGAQCVVLKLFRESAGQETIAAVSGQTPELEKALCSLELTRETSVSSRTSKNKKDLSSILYVIPSEEYASYPELAACGSPEDFGQVIAAKMTAEDQPIGEFLLLMPKNTDLHQKGVTEIFCRQTGLLLKRILLEKAYIKSDTMLRHAQAIAKISRWEYNHQYQTTVFSTAATI